MHVHVVQPGLPFYRVDFFRRVAERLGKDFTLYYTARDLGALTTRPDAYPWTRALGPLRAIGPGLSWQVGALSLPVAPGDVVVVSGGPRCLSNLAILVWARLKGARTVWWGQYWSASSRQWRFLLRMALMRLSEAVLFYTDAELDAYRTGRRRPDPRPLAALNNGINIDPIVLRRAPYDGATRPAALLFIGRLTPKAELGVAIAALAEPALAGVRLEVIGSGDEKAGLQALADRLGVGERIIWHGGMTDEDQISAIANRTALFVYPGAVGLSLIHAMAYGLPALVHADRRRHMPEIGAFEDGVTGRTFRRGDAASLAASLAGLLADPAARATASQAAVTRTETSFNTKAMAARFCALIDRLRAAGTPS